MARLRSLARANAAVASAMGKDAVMSGARSSRLSLMSLTASANSAWKRKDPHTCNSLATITFWGMLTSPPMPSCTTVPRGRITSSPSRKARSLPEHSNITSKLPLSAALRATQLLSVAALMVWAAPMRAAMSSGSSTTSVATTSAAPCSFAAATASTPMGPQPDTSTRLPSSDPARLTACNTTEKGSASAAVASGTPSATVWHWLALHTSALRKAPWMWGVRMALP